MTMQQTITEDQVTPFFIGEDFIGFQKHELLKSANNRAQL
jgi:hypothetical protein